MNKRKVVLIGWDAADWKIINPLLDSGQLPALESIVNGGVMGNIATLEPVLSPILWTSIATGKYADKHGIFGFTEPDSLGTGVRPVLSTSRTTKALWNILMQNGYKTHNLGWWPSHPAEPLNGITISNLYGKPNGKSASEETILAKSIHPAEYTELFKKFRVHPSELSAQHILPFVPNAEKVADTKAGLLNLLAGTITEATNYHSAATWIMENEEWDFLGIYFNAIDKTCHNFMNFHPPRLPDLDEEKYELYKEVVNGMYRYHDMMLSQLLKHTDEDTIIMLVSDHGFNSDDRRLIANPNEPAGIAYDHRPYGVVCIKGKGIKKDERIYGASLLDVTPTLLHACGLPIGRDMDGKVLAQIFEEPQKIDVVDSWDTIDGNSGFVGNLKGNATHHTTPEELQQLVELGYIDDPGDNVKLAVDKSIKENRYNKARMYIHSGRYVKAERELEDLVKDFPTEYRFHVRLAMVYQILTKNEECLHLISTLKEKSEEENRKKNKERELYKIPVLSLQMLEGKVYLNKNEAQKALDIYNELYTKVPMNPKLLVQQGSCYSLLKNNKKTIECYAKAIDMDADNVSAHVGLAKAYSEDNKHELSAQSALDAISLVYHYPMAHFYLGLALYHMEDYEYAANAFEVCLMQNSAFAKARNLLIKIYQEYLPNKERTDELKTYFEQKNKAITIVSGIPRSGTSLMMQMLKEAGVELFTDNNRAADENNKKGYFEHEFVKALAANDTWLGNVGDKAVKIVSQLLFNLPDRFNYKIIFMKRDLKEIIHSQQAMLKRDKGTEITSYPLGLEKAYEANLKNIEKWATNKNNVEILYVDHRNLFNDPKNELEKISAFLEKEMSLEEMLGVIDPQLYRSVN